MDNFCGLKGRLCHTVCGLTERHDEGNTKQNPGLIRTTLGGCANAV